MQEGAALDAAPFF